MKKIHPSIFWSAAALAALAICPAWAQQELSEPTALVGDARFAALDANHDGRIDSEEYLAEKKREWARYSNGSSMPIASCAQAALDKMAAGGAASPAPEWVKSVQGGCSKLDKKRDGALTWEEFAGSSWSFFKLLDANHDGYLSPQELADQGLAALRSLPKPPPMTARQQEIVARDLQRVRTMHRAPRTVEQVQTELRVPAGPRVATAPLAQPGAPAQPAATPEAERAQGIAERVSNWLK